MSSNNQLKLAYRLATVLFVVGVLSYAFFSAPAPAQPVRMMLHNAAGKVLFDHKTHSAESGYAISCSDCHHNLEPGEMVGPGEVESCGACHEPDSAEDGPKRSDAFHQQCRGCHEDYGAGPKEKDCAACHVP